ncbi:MAG: LAGLIDADG family homing endonuclease [Candidatus Pacebacteria bacterium]|nr:LAGLIDADG family homing endonuclease [Candidatus Paceibacterota bacterium]
MYNNKVNESMMLFYSQLNEPKLSFDYFNRHKIDSHGKPFECRVYQVDYQFGPILRNSMVIAGGRSLGKSFFVAHYIFKWCITHPGLHCGIIVKNEVHARGLVKYIDDYFGINEFTSSFYVSYDKKNRLYTLSNGCTIEFRIAGADKSGATTLVAGHFNLLIIDEAQLMYATTLPELIPMLIKGGKMIVTGVPNNLRDMILYQYCTDPDVMYYKYASTESADWDEEKEKEFLKHYKGGKDSPQWKNLVCLPKGQMVVVPNGLKDISEIEVGDLVLTHKNRFKKVTETFKREYSGNINIINQSYDDNLLITTDNHPISCRKKKTRRTLKTNTYEELKFIEAKNIEKNDKIQFANIEIEKEKLTFTLPDFPYRGVVKRANRNKWHCNIGYNNKLLHLGDYNTPELAALRYNVESWKLFKEEGFFNNIDNTIDIDEEIMYALGLYTAEGSTTKYHVCYSLHMKEIDFVDKLNKFFKRTPHISHSKIDKSMQVVYGNKVLAKLFKTLIPGVAHTKYINFNIYSLDDKLKIAFLRGYFDGDGCTNFNKGELCYKSSTASINLAYQLRLLLRSLKINTSLNTIKEGKTKIRDKEYNRKKQYALSIYGYWAYELAYLFGDRMTNEFNKKLQSKSCFEFFSNVISNKTEYFKGTVYNIEVEEDNSYTVFDSVVHNCAEWGDASESVFRPSKLAENIKEIDFQFNKMDVEFFDDCITRLKLPILNPKYNSYVMGSDSGYTERSPMHISILGCYNLKTKIDGEIKDREHYDLVCRIEISGMLSYEAAKLINYLLTYFNSPYFSLDAQNYGANIYSNLTNREIFPETCSRNAKIVLPIKFGDTIIIGEKKEFDLKTGKEILVDEKKAIKCATTDKIVELLENNRFHISNQDQGSIYFEDIYSILQCEVQTKSPTNNKYHPVTYSNSKNDHAVDSIRCCAYIIRQINERGLYFKFKKRETVRPIMVGSR